MMTEIENISERNRRATAKLFALLSEHHDYRMKMPAPVRIELLPAAVAAEPSEEFKAMWFGPIEEIDPPAPPAPRIEEVKRAVCKHFKISSTDIESKRRSHDIVHPRQIAIYLAKQFTGRSYPEIARRFGKRDHTTALHAVKRIEELCLTDIDIAHDVAHLEARFQ